MDPTLLNLFIKSGVRQDSINVLLDEELDTTELINNVGDELLRSCGLKAGQIARIRSAIDVSKICDRNELDISDSECELRSSTLEVDKRLVHRPSSSRSSSSQLSSCEMMQSPSSLANSSVESLSCAGSPCISSSPAESVSKKPAFVVEDHPPKQNWLMTFKLPNSYTPSVTEGLKAGRLSSTLRNEFTRDLCSAIRLNTLNPTKSEREHVSFMTIRQFPFLADTMGTGIGSWQIAIKNRFKNLRKTKRSINIVGDGAGTQKADEIKKRKTSEKVLQLDDGETEESCKDHIKVLKDEMGKTSNKKYALIKDLMEATYSYRRKGIITDSNSIEEVIKTYPALQLVSEIKTEFSRVVGVNGLAKSMLEAFLALQPKLLHLANERGSRLVPEMTKLIQDNPDKMPAIKGATSVVVLPVLFKERGGGDSVVKICSENESIDDAIALSVFPRLVGSGQLCDIDPLYIAAEGKVMAKLSGTSVGLPMALVLLIGVFYIFNIEYPAKAKNMYIFLEAILMDNNDAARKSVVVQKFLKELNS